MMDRHSPAPSQYVVLETPADWAPYGDAAKSPVSTACPASAGWSTGRTILDLWSYEDSSGVWVHVQGLGWKRLSPASQSGHTHMTVLAGAATHNNLAVDFHEDADGQIDQLIV
ncbi:hypothetical protein JOF56_001626 [Kibdelosporangium banguiense]|uniref:Uncharacterized protein n=1 Tax=Kibdelosporangium banguiense TaxID=1365924 RepID=A0ABS4T9Y8_9PSEU|nr:hypothetical protein [Kibdelosporangium banguiense]MBP2321241.1 hypothetical protein [Kibdelosporangium banguiense]